MKNGKRSFNGDERWRSLQYDLTILIWWENNNKNEASVLLLLLYSHHFNMVYTTHIWKTYIYTSTNCKFNISFRFCAQFTIRVKILSLWSQVWQVSVYLHFIIISVPLHHKTRTSNKTNKIKCIVLLTLFNRIMTV